MKLPDLPYRLFANCIPVKGIARSTICDIQRNQVHLIPNALFELLEETQGKTMIQIKKDLNHKYDEVIDEYFDFLNSEELIFFDEQPHLFPPLNLQWHSPSPIINAIIDLNRETELDFNKVIKELDSLDCKYVQIRIYDSLPIENYYMIAESFNFSTIVSIEIILPFDKDIPEDSWINFCDKYKRITGLVIHSSFSDIGITSKEYAVPISYIKKIIPYAKCCGIINMEYFTSYITTFTESIHHNSCLNRKVSIDVDGNIKNCPSMKESYGNIRDTTLKEAIEKPGFKKYWNITKDQIAVCKDCEFRHICTDCRAYLENPENINSKPLKCGYNPYTCEWEKWSTNPLKQKAIDYYGMRELVKTESKA